MIKTINKAKTIETGLLGIFLIIFLYKGKETYAKSILPKSIEIIGWTSLNNRNNAMTNTIKGTIFW